MLVYTFHIIHYLIQVEQIMQIVHKVIYKYVAIHIRDLLNDTFPQNRIKSWFSFRELLHTFRELSVAPKTFGFRNCI